MMDTGRRSHMYEQLPYAQNDVCHYEYPKSFDESPSMQRLLPHGSVSLSEDGSLASGGVIHSLTPRSVSQVCYQNAYRKRENPLYQSINHVDPKSSESQRCSCSCSSIFTITFALLAFAISCASIGIALNRSQGSPINHTYVADLEKQLESVLDKYDQLLNQVAELKRNDSRFHSQEQSDVNQSLIQLRSEILTRINRLQNETGQKISNVSKMLGPVDPRGSVNLTACRYAVLRAGNPSVTPETATSWMPYNKQESETIMITGIECSTESGTGAFLSVSSEMGFTQFRCRCIGREYQIATSRFCSMHYWSCPVNS